MKVIRPAPAIPPPTLTRIERAWLTLLLLGSTLVILLSVFVALQQEENPPVVWDQTDIWLSGSYCPGDTIEYSQGLVALADADVRSVRTIQRTFGVTGPADFPIAIVEPSPVLWSVEKGQRVEYDAEIIIPMETFLGRSYVAGPHQLLISVTDPNRRSRAARFRVHFDIEEGCAGDA